MNQWQTLRIEYSTTEGSIVVFVEGVEVFRDEDVTMSGMSQAYVTIGSNHSPAWTSSNVGFYNLQVFQGQ